MRYKKSLLIILMLAISLSIAIASVPVQSQDSVTFYVNMPDGYFPSVAPGELVGGLPNAVEVWIDSPTGAGIVGWALSLQWDPTVIEIGWEFMGIPFDITEGTFLSAGGWPEGTLFLAGSIDKEGGKITSMSCMIKKYSELPPGSGAEGAGPLVRLYFTSLSDTQPSIIDLIDIDCMYYTQTTPEIAPDDVLDGWYGAAGPEFPLGIGLMMIMAPMIPLVYIWRLRKKEPMK